MAIENCSNTRFFALPNLTRSQIVDFQSKMKGNGEGGGEGRDDTEVLQQVTGLRENTNRESIWRSRFPGGFRLQ